jgi:transcriptional regulator with XRE-family HTH domain
MSMQNVSQHDARLEFDLADRLRRALRVSDVSVQEMSEYLGVSRGAVSTWINGRITPGRQTLRLFALRTGFPFEWLESGEVSGPAPSGPTPPRPSGTGRYMAPVRHLSAVAA